MTKFSPYEHVAYTSWHLLSGACPPGTFRTLPVRELVSLVPDLAPSGLVPKLLDTAVVMHSGTGATSVVGVNFYRDDPKAGQIDQQPLLLVYDHPNARVTAGFANHGGWDGRSIDRQQWLAQVAHSGLPRFLPLSLQDLPSPSGQLEQLKDSSHHDALWDGLRCKNTWERNHAQR